MKTAPASVAFLARERSRARARRVDAITAEVLRQLQGDGVRPVLLKGPTFASWLYTDGSPREYVDTDLLVAPADLPRARDVLSRLGFEPTMEEGDIPGSIPHDCPWVRALDGAVVDLHRQIPGANVEPQRLWDLLMAGAEINLVDGVKVATLSERARALHVALHAAQHGSAVPKPLEDLRRALIVVDRPTWRAAKELADAIEATAAFSAGLRLLPQGDLLATELGLPYKLPADVALLASNAPVEALTIEALAAAPNLRARLALCMHKVAPSRRFIRAWFGPAASGRRGGLALGYVYRPLWLLAKAPGAWRAWRKARAA